MKNLIKSSIVIATLAMGASAALADTHERRADRAISKEEFLQRAAKRFDLADTNKDGKLSFEERKAMHEKHKEEREQARLHHAKRAGGPDGLMADHDGPPLHPNGMADHNGPPPR